MLRPAASCRITFDGQSLVNQPDWYGEAIGSVFIGWSWPRIAMADLGLPGYTQPAVGGTSMTSLASSFGTRAAKWIAPESFEPTIYVLCAGTQDYLEGDTGAQVYADAGALADLARAAGAVYVVCTTTFPATGFSETQNTRRETGNGLILADGDDHFDATIDFEVSGLDDPFDGESYIDGTHIYGSRYNLAKGTGRAAAVAMPVLEAAVAAVT